MEEIRTGTLEWRSVGGGGVAMVKGGRQGWRGCVRCEYCGWNLGGADFLQVPSGRGSVLYRAAGKMKEHDALATLEFTPALELVE